MLFFLSGKYTMQEAFVLTRKKHFGNGVKLAVNSGTEISLSEILKPDEQLPTKRQFRYVCDRLQAELGKRDTKAWTCAGAEGEGTVDGQGSR
jgi:hypothetical protein